MVIQGLKILVVCEEVIILGIKNNNEDLKKILIIYY